MSDSVIAYGKTYTDINGFKVRDAATGLPLTYIRPQGTKVIRENGTNIDVSKFAAVNVNVSDGSSSAILGTKTITANGTYAAEDDALDGYSSVTVNVPTGSTPTGTKQISISSNGTTTEDVTSYASAEITVNVPNSYAAADEGKVVSSGALVSQTSDSVTSNGTVDTTTIKSLSVNVPTGTARTSADLTASGATVNVPAGLYVEAASKSVASGTEGTPTASKGTVSNNSITVTPSVTNSAGYISGGTHNGTGVTVSASELVSGTKSITASGTTDVTNYASASVAAGTAGTPSATKGSVSNHSISVTPSVTNTTGFITGSTINGTAVTVSASELVSGSTTITENGTTNVTNLASVTVAVPFSTIYSGSSDPSSSQGANGDIYIKVVS